MLYIPKGRNIGRIEDYKLDISQIQKPSFTEKPQNLVSLLKKTEKNLTSEKIKEFRDYEFEKYFPEIHFWCIIINLGGSLSIALMLWGDFLSRVI